ncbi:MAG: DUF4214 domain-containing protein [Alteromonadaceae bacterium]|nr:DUF4214 domain-containing protein [Alteromonadaceae bacterium]
MALNGNEIGVINTYVAITGEAPSQAELQAAFETTGLNALATELLSDQAEPSNTAFVTSLYENLLDRTPDQEGLEYWTSLLGAPSELSKARLAVEFQYAADLNRENEENFVDGTAGLSTVEGEFATPTEPDDGDEEPVEITTEFDFNTDKGASDVTGWTHTKSDETGEVSHDTGEDSYMSNTHKIYNVGIEAIDQGVSTIAKDYTFRTENQLGDHGHYEAYMLSPLLDNVTTNLGSQLTVEVIDRMAEADNKDAALSLVAIESFSFRLNGEDVVVGSDDILNAETYTELVEAIQARIDELAEDNADLNDVTVELGGDFTRQQVDPDTLQTTGANVLGSQVVLTAEGNNLIERGGFSFGQRSGGDRNVDPSGRQDTSVLGSETDLITTNLEFQNVGYGSQGGSVNVSGQSMSDRGVEQFDITAEKHNLDLGVWLTELSSQPLKDRTLNTLEVINLTGAADYFHVGTEQNSAQNVDGGTVVDGKDNAGITDVREFNADNFAQNVRINAQVTEKVVARDLDRTDDDAVPAGDNLTYDYNLGNGDNQLFLSFSESVISFEDVELNITTGTGNDRIVLTLDNDGAAAPSNWYDNQKDQKNIVINSGSGDDVVATPGAGDATIIAGAGNDVVYTDNSGEQTGTAVGDVKAHWAFNSEELDVTDLLGGTGSPLAGTSGETGPYFLYNTKLTVTLSGAALTNAANLTGAAADALANGFEAQVDVPTGSNYAATERHINQAIKEAINEDDVLSALLEAIDGPNDTLIVRSLIDGEFSSDDLRIELNAPTEALSSAELNTVNNAWAAFNGDSSASFANSAAALTQVSTEIDNVTTDQTTGGGYEGLSDEGTPATNNSSFATDGTNPIAGANSGVESNNVVNLGAGTDVVVMGTGVDSNDTLVVTGSSIGHNTVVNFVADDTTDTQGYDFIDFTSYLTGQIDVSGSGAGNSVNSLNDTVATTNSVNADQVVVLTFNEDSANNETWADLNGADLIAALNGTEDWGTGTTLADGSANLQNTRANVDSYAASQVGGATFVGDTIKNIVLVDSNHNRGEYKVFEVTSSVEDAGGTAGDFGSAQLLGVIDFGAEVDTDLSNANLIA